MTTANAETTTTAPAKKAAAKKAPAKKAVATASAVDPTEATVSSASAGVVDANYNADDWVTVVFKGDKSMPPGQMPRAYFDGWGKDLGWTEVK